MVALQPIDITLERPCFRQHSGDEVMVLGGQGKPGDGDVRDQMRAIAHTDGDGCHTLSFEYRSAGDRGDVDPLPISDLAQRRQKGRSFCIDTTIFGIRSRLLVRVQCGGGWLPVFGAL